MTAASWVTWAALGEGCLASAGAWARTPRAGPYSPAATARTPTQSHRRALRTKLVNDMVLSPLSWALDRRMGGCPPGEILVEDRAPGPCDRSGANESMNSFRQAVPPTAARNAVLPISCGHIDRGGSDRLAKTRGSSWRSATSGRPGFALLLQRLAELLEAVRQHVGHDPHRRRELVRGLLVAAVEHQLDEHGGFLGRGGKRPQAALAGPAEPAG